MRLARRSHVVPAGSTDKKTHGCELWLGTPIPDVTNQTWVLFSDTLV